MGRMSLLSLGLLLVPVAVTVGVLIGLDTYRFTNGQTPLFVSNAVRSTTYCQQSYNVIPETDGQHFILNPNQWGVPKNYNGTGGLCMNITTWDNGSYPTNTTAPPFSVTWEYPPGPPTQPVHAFPNIQLDAENVFPVRISEVQKIEIDAEWSYGVKNGSMIFTDAEALEEALVNTNVAIDMFLDADAVKSTDTNNAKYEVMVWIGVFGPYTQQIGLRDGAIATEDVNGTTFNLYYGVNGLNQSVFTWVATEDANIFVADIEPLLRGLTGLGGPTIDDYLGYLAFGSEALNSGAKVTFSVPQLRIGLATT